MEKTYEVTVFNTVTRKCDLANMELLVAQIGCAATRRVERTKTYWERAKSRGIWTLPTKTERAIRPQRP